MTMPISKLNRPTPAFAWVVVVASFLAFAPAADAGLNSRATNTVEASMSGTAATCASQIATTTKVIHYPRSARRVRYEGPDEGDPIELTDEYELPLDHLIAVVDSVSSKRRDSSMRVTVAVRLAPAEPCTAFSSTDWYAEFELGASFGMRSRDRFTGFLADYDGDRQRSSYTGDYHSIEFRDRLGLRTRYKVCARGLFGSQCWRRSTDSDGYSSIGASIEINDRVGPGTLSWYVDGRRVSRYRYSLKAETV